MSKQKKIVFVGGGNMAKAIIYGLINNGYSQSNILVVDTSNDQLDIISNNYAVNVSTSMCKFNGDEIIILATKPHQIEAICETLKESLSQQLIISIAAGLSISNISKWLNDYKYIVRTMPNLVAKIQRSMTALYCKDTLVQGYKNDAEDIFNTIGKVLWLNDESKIDAVTSISGSGPAYIFYFLDSLIEAGEKVGLDREEAELLAHETLLGSAIMSESYLDDLGTLVSNVSSKGGTTEQAINVLKNKNFKEIISQAVASAFKRAVEIGNNR